MIDMHGYQVVPWQIEIIHSAVQRTAVLVVVLLVLDLVRAYRGCGGRGLGAGGG